MSWTRLPSHVPATIPTDNALGARRQGALRCTPPSWPGRWSKVSSTLLQNLVTNALCAKPSINDSPGWPMQATATSASTTTTTLIGNLPGDRPVCSTLFLDVNRHVDSWLPLLQEADARLRDKIRPDQNVATGTPLYAHIQPLVPSTLTRVQLAKTPKQRRLPIEVIQEGAKHRGAALWLSDGSISLEAEAISGILAQSSSRFTSPVRAAIFFFGVAPDSRFNAEENAKPEAPNAPKRSSVEQAIEEEETMKPYQPGYRDITFPGLRDAPRWLLQMMRRLHTNLGHPSTSAMVRHLSAAGASDMSIQAAKHLRCEVCRRVQPPREPRPTKVVTTRRFNDKLGLDILWLKDISGKTYPYLSQVDQGTCYHACSYLGHRSEETTVAALVNGWFTFFGVPDEIVLDADGAFRGFRFEHLQAQSSVKVRFVPPDAHYQMGRAERHGQTVKHMVRRLVSQFAPTSSDELSLLVAMSTTAKNSLMNKSGSSPAQWVCGQNPRLPGALLSSGGSLEAAQLANDSQALQHVEAVRASAMKAFHDFEFDTALRAALLRKPRPLRGPFHEGQRVAYWRARATADGEGTNEGYRLGAILALDGNSVWIRNMRGRLICASKEQVRDVAGEESEWWLPESDLRLLRLNPDDAAAAAFRPRDDAPQLAFRPQGVPAEATDRSALDELSSRAHGFDNNPLAPLDAAGQPLPLPSTSAAPTPTVTPLLIVPQTPRTSRRSTSAPRTPTSTRTTRGRSKTPPRLQQAPLPPVPEEQGQLPGPELPVLPPQDQSGASRQTTPGASSTQTLPHQDQPGASRQTTPGASTMRRESTGSGSQGLTATLRQVMEEELRSQGSGDVRGLKRPAEAQDPTSPPAAPPVREKHPPPQHEPDTLPSASTLLLFCQDCGEQHRIVLDGQDVCARCSSTRTTSSPLQVESWFDEVMEREALNDHFEDAPPVRSQHPTPESKTLGQHFDEYEGKSQNDTSENEVRNDEFEDDYAKVKDDYAKVEDDYTKDERDNATGTVALQTSCRRSVHRLDVLRRHGRGMRLKSGWDGSPLELQPFFVSDNFLTAAHFYGDHTEVTDTTTTATWTTTYRGPATATTPASSTSTTTTAPTRSTSTTTTRAPTVEKLAHQMLEAQNFKVDTCLQLLDAAGLLTASSSMTTLGLDLNAELSESTLSNPKLTKYLLGYLRHHGMSGSVTSLQITKTRQALLTKNSFGKAGSIAWMTSLAGTSSAKTWVQCRSTSPPTSATWRNHDGQQLPGFLCNTAGKLVSFSADCGFETPASTKATYHLLAYSHAGYEAAPKLQRRKPVMKAFFVNEEDIPEDWMTAPVHEAYPLRAWQGQNEAQVMDTSGDEGDDGTHEASRARKQALKKELPWRSMSKEEIPKFAQAVVDEWAEWGKWSSCRPVWCDTSKLDPKLILASRVCFRWKIKADGSLKPKARIVVAGFRDPHLPLLTRDSPVLSRCGLACILQWAASNRTVLANADCKSAFLQGVPDTERPEGIFMRRPRDGVSLQAIPEWSNKQLLYKLTAPVYGQANAPRRWYLHVLQKLTDLGWTRHSLDPCVFLMRENVPGAEKISFRSPRC